MQNNNQLPKINGINPNLTINRAPASLNLNPIPNDNGNFIFKQTEETSQNNQQLQSISRQSNQTNTNTQTNPYNVSIY